MSHATTTETILLRLDTAGQLLTVRPDGLVPCGQAIVDLALPDEHERVQELLERAQAGEPAWAELRLILGGREGRWRAAIVPEAGGGSTWLLAPLAADTAIPWDDERALERWLGAFLVEQIEIGALVFDGSGRLRYRNATGARLLGGALAALPIGSRVETVLGVLAERFVDGSPAADSLRAAMAQGLPLRQLELVRHDGVAVELDYVPVRRDGLLEAHVVRVRDITLRRATEQRATAAEERYRALVELLPVVVYQAPADAIAETTYVSPQIEQLLGCSAQEWLAERGMWARHLHPDDRDWVVAAIERAVAEDREFALEYRMLRRDGTVVWVQDWGRVQRDARGGRFIHGVLLDISARKQAEMARAEAESRLEALIRAAPAVVFLVDAVSELTPDGVPAYRLRYANEYFEDLTGYPVEAWYRDPSLYAALVHPDDRERYARECLRTDETGEFFDLEYRLIRRDGRTVWVHERSLLLRDETGRPFGWQGLIIDITARKEAELALREAEERFRLLAEHHPCAVTIIDPQPVPLADGTYGWHTLYASPRIEHFTGYTAEEWSALGVWLRGILPEDRERVLVEAERWVTEGPSGPIEYRFRRKDGRVVWLRQEGALVRDLDGRPRYLYLIMLDVTEQRTLLEQLRLAEERYRMLVEQLPGVVVIRPLLPDAVALEHSPPNPYISPAIERLTGFTPAEWSNQRFVAQLHPEDRERVLTTIFEADRTGSPISIEFRLLRKDGSVVWVWSVSHVIRAADGTPLYRQVLLTDVTERKRVELALREAEERYRALVEQLPGAVIVRSGLAGQPSDRLQIEYVSPTIEQLTGFTPEEWHEPGRWSGQLYPDDRERVLSAMRESERTGAPLDLEYRYIRKDGRVVWLWHLARAIPDRDGRSVRRQVLLLDVTARKQAELAVREAEERYRALVEQLPGAVMIRSASSEVLPDGTRRYTFQYVSPGIELLTGFTPEEWLVPGTWTRQLHPEDRDRVFSAMLASEAAAAPLDIEYRLFRKDGSLVWIWHQTKVLFDEAGQPRYRQVLLLDITARKQAEEALRAAEAHYRTLVEQMPAAVVRVAAYAERLPDGLPGYETFYVSPQIEEVTGFTPEEWRQPGIWARQLHPADRDWVLERFWHHEETGEPLRLEYRFLRKDGEVVWLWHEVRAIRGPDGKIEARQAVLMDVTDRKRAEEALRSAEERFRMLVEQIPAALVILDPHAEWLPDGLPGYQTIYASPRVLDLTGYTPEEWAQLGILARSTHPDDRPALVDTLTRVERTGEPANLEFRLVRKDGQLAWLRMDIWTIRTAEGSVLYWHVLLLNITSEKETERALREAEERYRTLVEQLPAVVYVEGVTPVRYPNGRLDRPLLYVSPQIRELTGYSAEEHQRDRSLWVRAIHPDDYQRVRRETREAWATGRFHSEFRIVRADGTVRWLESTARLIRDADGKPLAWQGVMLDVTERKRIEEELRIAEERYRSLVEEIPAAVLVTAAEPIVLDDGTLHYSVTYVSQRIEEVTGFTAEEFVSEPGLWFARIHPDDRQYVYAEARRTDESGERFHVVFRWQHKDGRWLWLENRAMMVRDARGQPLFWHGILLDVTDRKRSEQLLVTQTTLLRAIAEGAPLSEVLELLCRSVEDQVPGLRCSVLLLGADGRLHHGAAPSLPPEALRAIEGLPVGPQAGSCGTAAYRNQPVYVVDTRTDPLWANFQNFVDRFGFRACWSTPIRDANGRVMGTVALYATEPRSPSPDEEHLLELATQLAAIALDRWRETEELRHRAFHDPLTGLPNRLLFLDRLEHALARAERDGGLAVLFVDLDDFKRINDTWGHGAGDLVLQEVARRLARSVRAADTVARFAGDEFTVLLEGISGAEEVWRIAERILAAFVEPIDFEVAAGRLSVSVGAAVNVGAPVTDSGSLLLAADQALYQAKRSGKARVALVVLGGTG